MRPSPPPRTAYPLLLALLGVPVAFTLGYVGNEDFWWYLASGEHILEQGRVPDRDAFLYTSPARSVWVTSGIEQPTWVTHSWLFTVLLAALHRIAGTGGVAALDALLVVAALWLVAGRFAIDRLGLANALLAALAIATALDRFTPRAEVAGWLLLLAFVALLDRERFTRGTALALVGLQWLWSNLHGSHPLGIGVALAFTLGSRLPQRRGPEAREAIPLWLVPALCVASLATPGLGAERVAAVLGVAARLLESPGLGTNAIQEWQPTYAGAGPMAWAHGLWLAIGALSFAAAKPPVSVSRALVFAGMAALAVTSQRLVSGFALVSASVAVANLADPRPALRARLGWTRHPAARALHASLAVAFGALCLATAWALWTGRDALAVEPRRSVAVERPDTTCPGAAAFVRERAPDGAIFNDIALGGYLIHALHPERQLFIDTRNLSAPLLRAYRLALVRPAAWEELEERFGFRTAILGNLAAPALPLFAHLDADPDWRLGFLDPHAAVFVRAETGAVRPEIHLWGRGREPGRAPFVEPAAPGPGRWVQRAGIGLLSNYLRVLIRLGAPAAVETLASAALDAAPHASAVRELRAAERLRSGRLAEAAEDYRLVAEAEPGNQRARRGYALARERLEAISAQ